MSDEAAVRGAVPAARLRSFAETVLVAAGMPHEHAAWSAEAMVWADLRGLPAHGVGGKLPQCVARIRAGGTEAAATVRVVRDLGAAVSLDAGHAWGQVAGTAAMRHAIDRARRYGVGLASVRHSSSAAAMGRYASLAVDAGMIGLAVTNGPALVAAPTGRQRVVGNQGHAIGCPGGDGGPLVYDAATTTMSTGAMDLAGERGESLPEGVLRDSTGRPTRDPAAWTTGLLEPIGGHRGFGLSTALEVLTGVLAGGDRYGADVGLPGDLEHRQYVSMLCVAVDPAVGVPLEQLRQRLEAYRAVVHASGSPEGELPRLPGERSTAQARRGEAHGITIPGAQRAKLAELADQLRVPPL